jgi:transglutaminase-like putative cysteine protease
MLMLLSITWSMELAGWVEGVYVVEWTALGGLFVGFLMTRLGWPRVWSHLLSVVVGAALTLAVVGRFSAPGVAWRDAIEVVAYHFDAWLRVALSNRSSSDAAIFVLLMTLLGWWIGYTSAWMVFGDHKVWQALLLSGAAMLLVAYASPPEVAPFFALYVLCALLLAIRLYVFTQEQSWTRHQARYDRDISLTFLRDGGVFVLAILVAVWIVPLLSSSSVLSDLWARFEGPWRTVGDEWNRLFSGVLGHNRGYENIPFGDHLALGGPIELGADIVMWVDTDGARYWRGAVYDRYDGRGWSNSRTLSAVVPAKRDFPAEGPYESRRVIEQSIVPNWSGLGQIFQLGQPLSADVPVEVQFSYLDPNTGETRDPWAAPASVLAGKTRIPVSRERPYRVFSAASIADTTSLRGAGDDYPDWVIQRYLQLPTTLPERVWELAQEIAGPHQSAYDRAVAIQDYLRRTIQYRKDIQPPPSDRDAIDYLLFESREGYCNYYASAMVVLARAVGIPTRLAVGYVGGELEGETGRYVVRELDTHAWVEVFFPRFGWVEFEPTASEPPIVRAESGADERLETPGGEAESRLDRDLSRLEDEETGLPGVLGPTIIGGRSAWPLAAIAVLAATVGAGAVAWRQLQRRRAEDVSRVGRIYRRMCDYTRLAGAKGASHQTPYEYAALVAQRIPQTTPYVQQIATIFVRDRFGPPTVTREEEMAAERAWGTLRPMLLRRLVGGMPELALSALRRRR